ncbi:hypothetical protein [Brevundimonas sp. C43]|uniref:hypothetical protein n=1 Tax=Brevundimonas sp. C43 TaxID=3068314 RepID=UPI00273F01FD|nr:hypothetical protein [Brevundimonas sp. C43]
MTVTQAPTPGPLSRTLSDPMERMVAEAFESAGIGFKTNTACGLDFAIDGEPVFVEVKQFHTPRIPDRAFCNKVRTAKAKGLIL